MNAVLQLSNELDERGEGHALATVVRVDRPVSARVGDRAVISAQGRLEGWIGGSCSEPIVVREAMAALAEGSPRLLRIRPPGSPGEPGRRGVVVEVTACASEGGMDVFVEPRLPRPRLVIAGSSVAARTLGRLAAALGYRITAVSGESATQLPADDFVEVGDLATLQLRPIDAVVVATMNRFDEEATEAALSTGAGYVGLIASRPRGAKLLEMLTARRVAAEDLDRVRTPAGLDLGPSTQEEIALAVLAEVVAERHRLQTLESEPLCAREDDAARAVDPVCGMTVAVLPQAPAVEHAGSTYYFCSLHCRSTFANAPESFAGVSRPGGNPAGES